MNSCTKKLHLFLFALVLGGAMSPSLGCARRYGGKGQSGPPPPPPWSCPAGAPKALQPAASDRCLVVTPAGTSTFFSETLYLTPVRSGDAPALTCWYGANSIAYVDGDRLFADSPDNGFRHALGPVSGAGTFCAAQGGKATGYCKGSHGRQGNIDGTYWAQLANPQAASTSLEPFDVGVWQGSPAKACLVLQSCSDARASEKTCQ